MSRLSAIEAQELIDQCASYCALMGFDYEIDFSFPDIKAILAINGMGPSVKFEDLSDTERRMVAKAGPGLLQIRLRYQILC